MNSQMPLAFDIGDEEDEFGFGSTNAFTKPITSGN
jgi:hypothetical protein